MAREDRNVARTVRRRARGRLSNSRRPLRSRAALGAWLPPRVRITTISRRPEFHPFAPDIALRHFRLRRIAKRRTLMGKDNGRSSRPAMGRTAMRQTADRLLSLAIAAAFMV